MNKNIIGMQVYINISKTEWGCLMDTNKTWTITGVKDYDEAKDWCEHFIIKDEAGTEKEIREVECVFVPDYSLPEERMIQKYLSDNGIWAEVYHSGDDIQVSISVGDWKHEHLWCRDLMDYIGYAQAEEEVTEENGSDCYSAIHTYRKLPAEYLEWRKAVHEAEENE